MQKVTVEPTANRMLNSNARRELFPFCGKSCPPTKPITKGIVDNEHGMSEVNTPETIAMTGASQSLSATASANDFKNSFILSSLSDLFSVLLRQSAQAAASADYFHSIVCNCLRDRKHLFRRVNFTRLSVTACGTASIRFGELISLDCL